MAAEDNDDQRKLCETFLSHSGPVAHAPTNHTPTTNGASPASLKQRKSPFKNQHLTDGRTVFLFFFFVLLEVFDHFYGFYGMWPPKADESVWCIVPTGHGIRMEKPACKSVVITRGYHPAPLFRGQLAVG